MSAAILESGRSVLRRESIALSTLAIRLDDSFALAVRTILAAVHITRGRVITSGIGKSGLIARKIAATLTSTGTPAIYLHPVEALHGDIGIVTQDDVALLVSKSGESDELHALVEYLYGLRVGIIALTGKKCSALGKLADVVLDVSVPAEACPHGLTPTTSTTAALAMGDALAVALMEARGTTKADLLRLHPAGAIGRSA